jgi:hypothetical protein
MGKGAVGPVCDQKEPEELKVKELKKHRRQCHELQNCAAHQVKTQINPCNSVFSHLCAWVLSNSLMEKRKRYATSFYDACSVRKA